MISPRLAALAFPILPLLGACDRGPTAPAASQGLELSVWIGVPNIGISPSYPRLTATLYNSSDEEITVVFPSSCALRPIIRARQGGIVYPGWSGCYQVVTPVTLAPGRSTTRRVVIYRVGATPRNVGESVTLPPGQYIAYAEAEGGLKLLEGQRITLRSRSVSFVQPEH